MNEKFAEICKNRFFLEDSVHFETGIIRGMLMTAEKNNFEPSNDEQRTEFEYKKGGVSTVLVPAALLKDFKRKCRRHKGKAEYFSFLIKQFGFVLECYAKNPEGLKTVFQKKNQDLKKVNFRARDEDWAELGTFSIASGRSRCLLFAILLIFDSGNLASVLKKAGLSVRTPPPSGKSWELLSTFGANRAAGHCIRAFGRKISEREMHKVLEKNINM